jgi:hypothetical protein
MFSALWAIANQEAGAPLGQAARHLYTMPKATITDVVPLGSATNVIASIQEPSVTHNYTAADLAAPLTGATRFYGEHGTVKPFRVALVEPVAFPDDS